MVIKDFGYKVIIKGDYIKTANGDYIKICSVDKYIAWESGIIAYMNNVKEYIGFGLMGTPTWQKVLDEVMDYISTF